MSPPQQRFFATKKIRFLAVHGPAIAEFVCYEIGKRIGKHPPLTKIVYREEYYGDHSETWFDIYSGDRCLWSVSERTVDEVVYAEEPDV